jgi:Tfp pilus assembly protein PilV
MERLTIRLAALGAAVVITIGVLALAGLASRYWGERTKPRQALQQQDYTVSLLPPAKERPPCSESQMRALVAGKHPDCAPIVP